MANLDITKIPAPRTPFLDKETGDITPAWYRFLYNLFIFTGSGTGIGTAVNQGGTGQTSYTNGQLLIGNNVGNTLTKNTLTPGVAIGITNGNGTIAIANTGVTSIVAGSGISRSAATGNVTISNTGVTSIIAGTGIGVSAATGNVTITNTAPAGVTSFSAGTTGLTPNSPTTGAVVLAGTLAVANGGTGATTAAGAQANLGVTATGQDTTYAYRANNLSDLASASSARSNLGLGTMATENVGITATITTAKLTLAGANGSMTFVNGILTAQTQAT
jgi:hypothetical protein